MKISTQTMVRGKETIDWLVIPRDGCWEVYYGIPSYPLTFAFGLPIDCTTKEKAQELAIKNLYNYLDIFEEE